MRNSIFLILSFISLMLSIEASAQRDKKNKLENKIDSISYAIGISIGTSIQSQNIPNLNIEKISLAIGNVLNKQESNMSVQEAQTLLQNYMMNLQEEIKKGNLIKANAFLEQNKSKEHVISLPSGLQYKIIQDGEGISPTAANRVKTHYKGTLLDGTVFDSSYDRGEPITFGVTQVIKGWQEALQLMKPGAKWKLFVHPSLGYGERNTGSIPPNSLLIFEIELLEIE